LTRILWAEDGHDDQTLIRYSLDQISPKPKVTFVEDGVAALEALEGDAPDLVVLDINMPRMDGLQTLRTLRQAEATRHLRVVLFSTAREEDAAAEAARLGALEHIQKPIHYNDFAAAVARITAMAKRPKAGA
jgi:CheY-like chemotaxis protein